MSNKQTTVALAEQASKQVPADEMARFCPACGSVGEVDAKYRDCCPDGNQAGRMPKRLAEHCRDLFKLAISNAAQPSAPVAATEQASIDVSEMVNRFLGWKLPEDFYPDAGISFDRAYAEKWGMPVGTNLLHAGQAKAMFEHCTKDAVRPTDDHLWNETLRDRDQYHEWADKLAEAIAKHFNAYIGEHSNANCPWSEALDVIESAAPLATPADAGAGEVLVEPDNLPRWIDNQKGLDPNTDALIEYIIKQGTEIARLSTSPAPVTASQPAAQVPSRDSELIDRWASWIVLNRPLHFKDHACAQCVPHGDMLVDGFKCVFHEAKDVIGGIYPAAAHAANEGEQQ